MRKSNSALRLIPLLLAAIGATGAAAPAPPLPVSEVEKDVGVAVEPRPIQRIFDTLRQPDRMRLLVLNPSAQPTFERDKGCVDCYREWKQVAELEITDPFEQQALAAALKASRSNPFHNFNTSEVDYCGFSPHYVLQVWSGDTAIDALLCFDCLETVIYEHRGERSIAEWPWAEGWRLFDAVVEKAGLPVPSHMSQRTANK